MSYCVSHAGFGFYFKYYLGQAPPQKNCNIHILCLASCGESAGWGMLQNFYFAAALPDSHFVATTQSTWRMSQLVIWSRDWFPTSTPPWQRKVVHTQEENDYRGIRITKPSQSNKDGDKGSDIFTQGKSWVPSNCGSLCYITSY